MAERCGIIPPTIQKKCAHFPSLLPAASNSEKNFPNLRQPTTAVGVGLDETSIYLNSEGGDIYDGKI